MDSGIPHSLLTSIGGVLGEIVFNDLSGDATATAHTLSDVATGHVWPGPGVVPASINADFHANGLPPGNGYLMQFVGGSHGAPVRATIDNRPHKAGGIVHKFFSGPKYLTLTGLIVADDPEIRQVLADYLAMHLLAAQNNTARHFFNVPGAGQRTRFHAVKCYSLGDIVGPTGSPGSSPAGIAGPKTYDFEFVAVNPYAYTYTERDNGVLSGIPPTVNGGTSIFIANEGTAETWPVIEVFCIADGVGASFTVSNGVFDVEWAGSLAAGNWIEIDMFEETMFMNGNSSNKLSGLNDQSDFWSIPPGGCTVSVTPGADHIFIKSNDAWI